MIKRTLVDYIYDRHGGKTRNQIEQQVDALLDIIQEAIDENETVTITHFGRFRHKKRNVREIILPSGERMLSSSGERVQFLPSPKLKTLLNSEMPEEDSELNEDELATEN